MVIMGCGRVGSMLAHALQDEGHSVAVIDQDAAAFRRLGQTFKGSSITGVGFDRQVLEAAGIDRADAFAAVSSGDNSNILAARVAREDYGVKEVVARIYDPKRAAVYQRLGIPTVATVSWTADQIMRRIVPTASPEEWRDPSGRVVLTEMKFHDSWVGTSFGSLEEQFGCRVALITRLGDGVLPAAEGLLQEGDLLHLVLTVTSMSKVAETLGQQKERR